MSPVHFKGMRGILVLLFVITLAACSGGGGGSGSDGGSEVSYTVGGTISGLSGTGLVLKSNVGEDLAITANGSFTFSYSFADGDPYSVTVRTQPASQECTITNGSGTISAASITNISISCVTTVPTYTVGGLVSGLTSTGLVLQNNAGDDLNISADGSYTFATALTDGSSYSVSVLTQPLGQSCDVTSGSGALAGTNVTDVSVTCADLPTYTIGGSVTGLTGTGLVLKNNAGDDLPIAADGAFTFTTSLYDTSSYAVTVSTQPTGQYCSLSNNSGTLAGANVTNVAVSCGPIPTYILGGTVSGLTGTGLILQNNGGDDLVIEADGAFTFATEIEEGSSYDVTVKTQPSSPEQSCMVVNGSNTVSGGGTDVVVVCDIRKWGTASLLEADDRYNAYESRVAIDPNGNATVVWELMESPNSKIYARRFNALSNSWGAAKLITSEDLGDAETPRVAMDANGNAIAVWEQDDGTDRNIWAARYDALAGSWSKATLIENNPGDAGSIIGEPRIAMHADGDAIVVWGQYTAGEDSIWSNRYDALSGTWSTAELLENDDTSYCREPDVAMDANGNAMVVWWQSFHTSAGDNVRARRFDALTATWGASEVIESFGSISRATRVGVNDNGDAVAVWQQYDGGDYSTAANRYDAASGTWGAATYLETNSGEIRSPVVAIDATGNAIVVWDQTDGTRYNIWSNRYDAASSSWSTAVPLENIDVGGSVDPKIAMDGSGNAIVTWGQYDGIQRSAWVNHYNAAAGGWAGAMPIETSDRYIWYPEIAMNASGSAIGTWSQRDSYSTFSTRDNIWVNHYSDVPVSTYIPTFTIGGTVSGLTGSGLVLQNNGGDDLAISADGDFTFSTPILDGSSYTVTVKTQPSGQFCTATNGSGVLVGADVTDVVSVTFSCEALPSYTVSGSVTGLAGTGLELQNNAGDDVVVDVNGGFTFSTLLFGGETYAITVKTQPSGQACAVTNGNGTITGANITNVSITCATPYTIGGTVLGLSGTGLVLQNNAGDDIVINSDGDFVFPISVVNGFGYDVRVRVQPVGQSCLITGGTGTVNSAAVTTVLVNCENLTAGQYLVGGAVSGLLGSGLVLQNNAGDDITVSTDGSFTFPTTVAEGGSYGVSIKSQPVNPRQTCSITNSSGLILGAHVSGVSINCTTNMYTVRASVSGLENSGLVIRNNDGNYIAASNNGNYTFSLALPDGSPYAVTIKTQPSSQTCSVTNDSGTISGVNVTDVVVKCRGIGLYSIGGAVTNMRGSWLGLTNNSSDGVIVYSDGSFSFPGLLTSGETYQVTVGFDAVGQTCSVSNGSGTVSTADITNINVNCITNAGVNYYSVGGAVSGLKGSGLVLQNNKGDDLVISSDGNFAFPRTLTDGSLYTVSVKKQPVNLNQTCKVISASGELAGADVTNVSVECTTNTYDVMGTITGLAGSSVALDIPGWYGVYGFAADGSFSFPDIPDGTAFRVRVTSQPTDPNQTCTVTNGASTINGSDITNLQVSCVTIQYTIGGNLIGMKGSGITLANNGFDTISLSANGAFVFPESLDDGSHYSVNILAQPTGPTQECLTANTDAWLAGGDVSNVLVNCSPWTWVSGSNETAAPGVYGTQGVEDPANVPRARDSASSWMDNSGNFWLFGGYSFPLTGVMNDLWKYDPVTGLWTWMKGSDTTGASANFGTQGVDASTNDPGARTGAMTWQDSSSNLWLFSGNWYNDLWKYDTATGNWTWVSGTNLTDQAGIYTPITSGATKSPAFPGPRDSGLTWTDSNGNLWLFGGDGNDSAGIRGRLNDLWKYDPVNDLWTWESGADVVNQAGVYGTKGVADTANSPGARDEAVSWVGPSGNLWLFGGNGYDSAGSLGYLNDLWKFDVTSGNWTWVAGSNLVNQAGSYGNIGTASASNIPPPRYRALAQTDSSGNFWLYGGTSNITTHTDLWKYDTVTGLWTWVAGSDAKVDTGVYGTLGLPDALNIPGSRHSSVGWLDNSGTLWVFGGYGYVAPGYIWDLNDLWKITP